jgi:Na+-transporting NADH:ubiquinone oxidoreductase subunit A
MAVHRIKKGLDIPLAGDPEQKIYPGPRIGRVALLAEDYLGLRPTMFVQVGDEVRRGQPLFEDKKNPGVVCTSPAAGTVVAINRGERRAFQSVVIELNERERSGQLQPEDRMPFEMYAERDPKSLTAEEARGLLLESGMWAALRRRPFSRVARPSETPHSIFVTATDTHPHAPSVAVVMAGREAEFDAGVTVLSRLADCPVYVCRAPGLNVAQSMNGQVRVEEFEGPHPAGNPGLHIHMLDPVHREKVVWHIGYQDVIAIGRLFTTGQLDVERVVSLAGPMVKNPRLIRTRLGASTADLTAGELEPGDNRVISGSVLSGRTAMGEIFGYLGRYHRQVSVLREGRDREFLGWLAPGADKFSVVNVFLSKLLGRRRFNLTTNLNGSERAMVPIGTYEKVNPMDIQPTYLLRALIVGDTERAVELGCLELDEDDVALFTFVCPGKYDYGPILRRNLDEIEREG